MTFWSLVQPAFFFPNETEAQSSRRAYQFLFNSEMFSPVWPTVHMYPVKMVTKNTFSPKWKIFENAGFSFTYGQTKTEVLSGNAYEEQNP